MAYTQTPMNDTYQTKLVPMIKPVNNRAPPSGYTPNVDIDPLNLVYDKQADPITGEDFYSAASRDGFVPLFTFASQVGAGDTVFGIYLWRASDFYIIVTSSRILVYNALTQTLVTNHTTGAASPQLIRCNFQEFVYNNGTEALIVSAPGRFAIINTAGAVTAITIPGGTIAGRACAVMDGYVFATDGDAIWNSNNNVPTTWSPSNFIHADNYAGKIHGLYRLGTYIVALTSSSIQYFYDQANATGTPLGAVQNATKRVGTMGGECQISDQLFLIGWDNGTGIDVYLLTQDGLKSIGTSTIRKWLSSISPVYVGVGGLFPPGKFMMLNGHRFYMINHPNSAYSYGYDMDTQEWIRFSGFGGDKLDFGATYFGYHSAGGTPTRYTTLAVLRTSYWLYYANPSQSADQLGGGSLTAVPVRLVTDNLDFNTRRLKFASRLLLHCDQTNSTTNVSWSDDDYQTFSSPRSITNSLDFPVIHQLGSFRKRAFKIEYASTAKTRWDFLELDYNQGQT